MKNSLVCKLWSWTKLYIDEMSLIQSTFFYWFVSR